MGTPLRRNTRSHIRATSRWLVKRILPNLEKRSRSRRCSWRGSSGGTADQPYRDAAPLTEVLPGALAPPGRRHGGRHHVLDPEARAGAAVVARRPAAILHCGGGQGV